jgi:hypothetical protein
VAIPFPNNADPTEKPNVIATPNIPNVMSLFDNDLEDFRRDVPSPLELGRVIAITLPEE